MENNERVLEGHGKLGHNVFNGHIDGEKLRKRGERLPKEWKWEFTERSSKKGRMKGGIVLMKKELKWKDKIEMCKGIKGVKLEGEKWSITMENDIRKRDKQARGTGKERMLNVRNQKKKLGRS